MNDPRLRTAGSLKVIEAMGPQVRTVADGEEIFPGVHVMLTPGHKRRTHRLHHQRRLAAGDPA